MMSTQDGLTRNNADRNHSVQSELRKLPSVDRLLNDPDLQALSARYGHSLVVSAAQEALAGARVAVTAGQPCPDQATLSATILAVVDRTSRPSLCPVINATGVIIHTNLGRSPLSQAAQDAMRQTSAYSNLEYDLLAGERGSRYVHAEALLCRLTGADAALVVNNDAAAILLVLMALAQGREVVISRGQLVEIGGGFRIPEVLAQSGARLVEVGTTNRTYLRDYETALGPESAMLLHVHSSNFRLTGFVHETPLAEVVTLAHAHNILAVDDLGSGALLDTAQFGLSHEPTVQESLATGADLVCVSGDKLLGGPQAGLILGNTKLIGVLKRHPLTRALRVSKSVLAGLQATLLHYLKDEALREVPVWQMMALQPAQVGVRAGALVSWLKARGIRAELVDGTSAVGGGTLPGETLRTSLVAIQADSADSISEKLRLGSAPVLGRIEDDRLVLDLRTVLPSEEEVLRKALQGALLGESSAGCDVN
jgi:L-seryl-tRNA(Ser) seleniumtransferase